MSEETTVIMPPAEKKSFGRKALDFAKSNWKPLLGLATAGALKVGMAVFEHKREQKKLNAYIDNLEERTELQREALSAYKDSLSGDDPRDEDE